MQELRVTVRGNVVANPEERIGSTGRPFTTFSVACNIERRQDNGSYEEVRTDYYRVMAFGALARNASASIAKGQAVIVHGRLQPKTYERANGSEGASIEIVADMLGHDLNFGWVEYHKGRKQKTDPTDPDNDPAVRAARQQDLAPDAQPPGGTWGHTEGDNWNSNYIEAGASQQPAVDGASGNADSTGYDEATGEIYDEVTGEIMDEPAGADGQPDPALV